MRSKTDAKMLTAADGGAVVSAVVPSGEDELLEEELDDELDEEEDEEDEVAEVLVGVPGVVVIHSSGHSSSPGGTHSGYRYVLQSFPSLHVVLQMLVRVLVTFVSTLMSKVIDEQVCSSTKNELHPL